MTSPTKQRGVILLHALHALLTVLSLSAVMIAFGQLTQQFPNIIPMSSPSSVSGNTWLDSLPDCNLSDRRPGCG